MAETEILRFALNDSQVGVGDCSFAQNDSRLVVGDCSSAQNDNRLGAATEILLSVRHGRGWATVVPLPGLASAD